MKSLMIGVLAIFLTTFCCQAQEVAVVDTHYVKLEVGQYVFYANEPQFCLESHITTSTNTTIVLFDKGTRSMLKLSMGEKKVWGMFEVRYAGDILKKDELWAQLVIKVREEE